MKRRSNKSHRVPNVKLRPGEPQPSSSLLAIDSSWPEDTQLRSDDTTFRDTCPRPFRNVMLCATGISDKPALFKKALELGAGAISAFTDKVTHLIAVSHGGPKYKCALEHNIPIVRPSWIDDNYEIWLHGDDVEMDLDKSVEPHRLPVFSDVVVCLSGIPEIERRADIRRIVEQQGGTYVKAIERPVKVTHLLCSGDEETDKMRYAEKFISRREAQIHIVWEDWFWDSLKVRGRLDEARYNVRNPRPSPIVLRNTQPNIPDSTSNSRANSVVIPEQPAAFEPDALDDEAARVKIVPDITLKVWTGLLERRGYEVSDGEVIRSPSKSQNTNNKSRSLTPPPDRRRRPAKNAGVISAVRSTNTFESGEKEAVSNIPQRPLPFKRGSVSASANPSRANSNPPEVLETNDAGPSNHQSESLSEPQIFLGLRFCILGEAKTPAVQTAIESRGGIVVLGKSNPGFAVDIYLVRLLSGSRIYRSESEPSVRAKYRTECWLERSIHEERVCEADDDVSFMPLAVELPIPGANAVHIGLSGLDQSESCHTKRLLKAFGINLIPLFSRKATHLLCPSGLGLKYDKAREWGIPVVSNDWLAAVASTGVIPPADEYLVLGVPSSQVESVKPAPAVDYKGKGRAVDNVSRDKGKSKARDRSASIPAENSMDVDKRIHDITNTPLEFPQGALNPSQRPGPLGKAGSLERQATTSFPGTQPVARGGFGHPTEMLGSLSTTGPSSFYANPSSLTPLSHGSPLVKYGTNPKSRSIAHSFGESLVLHDQQSQPGEIRPNKSRKLTAQSTPSRRGSIHSSRSDNENDDNDDMYNDDMRVPSSKSPSPMKAPRRMASLSPAKLDPGAAKALQESIASLLGKRQSLEEEPDELDSLPGAPESVGESLKSAGSKSDVTKAAGKRKRPQRAKPSTRAKPKARKSPPAVSPGPGEGAGVSLSAFDPYGVGPSAAAADEHSQRFNEEQSVRVVYEDPAQREDRQRLMNMLKTTGAAEEEALSIGTTLSTGSVSSRTRRSTRVSGF